MGLHVYFPDVISVQAEAPWKDFRDVIEYAKNNPRKFRCGTLGVGSINRFRLKQIMIEDYENAKQVVKRMGMTK